jgi:hypothetical protein
VFRGDIEVHRHGRFAFALELGDKGVAHETDDVGIDQGPPDFGEFENSHGRTYFIADSGCGMRLSGQTT